MPQRPPKTWFDRCVTDVAAQEHAVKPAAVCGATWRDKTPTEKAFTFALEDNMPMKKHGKHKPKKTSKHGQHRTTRAGPKHRKTRSKTQRSPARTAHKKDLHHHKCPACGHLERHDPKAGCTHFDGHRFCPCMHRHR